MAPGADWNCPICHNTRSDVASALPCNDQFCLGCILRWAKTNPACPLCSRHMEIVKFSERNELDYLQFAITASEELAEDSSQAGSAPFHLAQNSPHHPGVSSRPSPQRMLSPDEQETTESEFMGGLQPEVWAELFQRQQHLLDPVLPWLRGRLAALYKDQWWRAEAAEGSILHGLCVCGPNAETLVELLEPLLNGHTASLVYGTINVIAGQCSDEAQRLLCFHHSSTNSHNSSYASSQEVTHTSGPAGSEVEEEAGTSGTGIQQSPNHASSMPICSEQDQPQEQREQMVAMAGPSARDCNPSAPNQGRNYSSGKPRRARKRRARRARDSPCPKKRPPCQ